MKSIRRQLISTLFIGLILLFAAASVLLFLYTRNAFIKQFDASLETRLTSFAGMSELEKKFDLFVLELEFDDFPLPEFQPGPDAEYYQVWQQDGTVIARSASLKDGDLARFEVSGNGPAIQDVLLPDGRKGRAAAIWFSPKPEQEIFSADAGVEDPENRFFMVMARSREQLDHTLTVIFFGYLVTGVLLVLGIVLIVRSSVRHGLQPLDRIALETSGIESSNLTHRFQTEKMPAELVPICTRLNELLERLESAFERERRFNADMAHELRTPISELRTLAEVALRFEPDSKYPDLSRNCFQDVLDIAKQMEKLVTTLLALVRSENGRIAVQKENVDLVRLIQRTARPFQEQAEKQKISFELRLPDQAVVQTDGALLAAILTNLFSNAVTHTPQGGVVCCEVNQADSAFSFLLKNTNDQLVADDLDHLFEPLWKKDPSRTDTESNGLGLSLVAAYSDLLGLKLKAALPDPDTFEISFKLF